jgi:OmpA-OmpF porin, OOP family
MPATIIRVCLALAVIAMAGPGNAHAQDLLNQDWLLNPSLSNVYMETEKANGIFEAHHFTAVEGNISKDGDATVRIELASLETGIDVRNVRMRFLLFETFKFPYAEISAKLDKAKLQALATNNRVIYPLDLKVSMHGIVNEIQTSVWVTRINDTTVSVAAVKPIIVTAESFGFTPNVAKLVEVIGGTPIATAASITFDLVFGTGSLKPDLEAERATRERNRAQEATQTLSAEACETRFSVISQTGAIYFKTGSADLDRESEPLLNSGADIANRCPSVRFEVEGHTDNVGSKRSNQALSEQRAKAVVDYLMGKGISAARIQSAGYGDTRPVAPNDSEANRAKNRRIEFIVKKN